MRCATNGPKIGVQPVKSSRKPHKGNSSLVDVQGGPNKNNPNLFPIGDGFGLFVFYGDLEEYLKNVTGSHVLED